MDPAQLLKSAEDAARAAGALLLARAEPLTRVLSAHGRDIKLVADREAEALILAALAPTGLPVLSEESGLHAGQPEPVPADAGAGDGRAGTQSAWHDLLPRGWCWIVDPLDGTFNYQRGMRPWAVSIALWRDGRPVAGVIFDPVADECFAGLVGRGATLNGNRITVRPPAPASQSAIATGAPVHAQYSAAGLATVSDALRRFKKVRMIGSAASSSAWIACGRLDAYAEEGIMLWDVAAGAALVLAAGGVVDVKPSDHQRWATVTRLAASNRAWEDEAR